jgi:hypothetical protein
VTDGDRVVIPGGAKVTGRVRQIRRLGRPLRAIEVGVEFTEAEWSTGKAQLALAIEEQGIMQPSRVGKLYVEAPDFNLPAGLRMTWSTLRP